MKASEMKLIAKWISQVLNNPEDATVKNRVHGEIKELCAQFPLY
jgi:glycine hydroxymethyltransferase